MRMQSRLFTVLGLFIALFVESHAGTVDDSAALFGNRLEEVRLALADLPVSIETRQTAPSEGLRVYADRRVNEEFNRGFVVVIATQPRGWRISMNPQSLASPEYVRVLGDRMAADFKRGRYVEGATQLATSLNQLTLSRAVPSSEVAKAPVYVPQPPKPVVTYPPVRPPVQPSPWGAFFFVVFFGILAIGMMVFFRYKMRKFDLVSPPSSPEDARRIFDAYTPAQRARLASRNAPHAAGDPVNDPMAFALMMYVVQQDSMSHITSNSSPLDVTTPTVPPSFDSGSSSISSSISTSSSDSSGASGSW
ncbi:MAG: hypothetical protein QM715_20535 [Nibricoccus sp.]